jgi:hypothetical protein
MMEPAVISGLMALGDLAFPAGKPVNEDWSLGCSAYSQPQS